MKKIISILAILAIAPLSSYAQNADFEFGSGIGFGATLFDNSNSITLGFISGGSFTALGAESSIGNDPFGNPGYANGSFSVVGIDPAAVGSAMYIKLSSGAGDAYITDSAWSTISALNPPSTPPLNSALIGHANAGQITADSLGLGVNVTSGGIGGTGLTISVVPEPSTYALIAGFAAFVFVAIRRRK